MGWQRVIAALPETCAIALLTAILTRIFPANWASALTICLILAPILMTMVETLTAIPAPSLGWTGLKLSGSGCLLCRNMRRVLPFTPVPATFALLGLLNPGLQIPALILACTLTLAHCAQWLFSLFRNEPAHWDSATGFQIIPRPSSW